MKKLILLGVLLLFIYPALAANCESYNTPKLFTEKNYYELDEGVPFKLKITSTSIEDRTTYIHTIINGSFNSFNINNKGVISVVPKQDDIGLHKILITGYTKADCFDSKLLSFKVYDKPELFVEPARGELKTSEGKALHFEAKAIDEDLNETLSFEWLLDEKRVSNETKYTFFPGYNSSGYRHLAVIVKDSRNLTEKAEWNIAVDNINRPPVLIAQLPSIDMFISTSMNIFNLLDYFKDPDGDTLTFTVEDSDYDYGSDMKKTNIQVNLIEGSVGVTTPARPGYSFYFFTATDTSNENAVSNHIRLAAFRGSMSVVQNYCGDDFCSAAENCDACPEDCGSCDDTCEPYWSCNEWGPCQVKGIQTRACTDKNECGIDKNKPVDAQECEFIPSCEDNLKNRDEKGIDCGGPCPPCGTCHDSIKNNAEEGIDCGGHCLPCASCEDNFLNQKESDIDCGGPCEPCLPWKACLNNFDCQSYNCLDYVCQVATCQDNIKNQHEEKPDCGGPCEPCASCHDNIINQGEKGTDCGGPCEECATCDDNNQNQGEHLTDCGGPCDSCGFMDYYNAAEFKHFFILIIIILLALVGLLRIVENWKFSRRRTSSFLERDSNLSFLIFLNSLKRLLRFRQAKMDSSDYAKKAMDQIKEATVKGEIQDALSGYFHSIMPLPEEATYDAVHSSIKRCRAPVLVKYLLLNLLGKLWFVMNETLTLEQEFDRIRKDTTRVLKELDKDL
ncbi:hypothetical protein ACFL1B_05610 [Nanoarchaeota archaeon]